MLINPFNIISGISVMVGYAGYENFVIIYDIKNKIGKPLEI